ncbi:phage protein [Solibacillus sp. FSL W8-0474]|uniref:phage structural protein n=1 Tax=Solibacillus sp. FSL W8-0474 TaxID=2975336 RepID=UPI0030FAA0DB
MNSYDPKKVSFVADGQFIVGYMDGTFITTEKNEDNTIPHVGAQGDVSFTESADETGTITITVKQNSSSLPFLTSLSKQKKEFAANVIDANDGSFKAGGTRCRILKTPGREYGAEISGVEIAIYVADYKTN